MRILGKNRVNECFLVLTIKDISLFRGYNEQIYPLIDIAINGIRYTYVWIGSSIETSSDPRREGIASRAKQTDRPLSWSQSSGDR